MHAFMYICMAVCMHVCVHAYTHAYTHACMLALAPKIRNQFSRSMSFSGTAYREAAARGLRAEPVFGFFHRKIL